MNNFRLRRLPFGVAAPWLIALALLVTACAPARDRGARVGADETPVEAAETPAGAAPRYGVADRAPTNILVPNARLAVTGTGDAVPPAAAPGQPAKVGLLLPLSGRLASVGRSMQDAAQMALVDLGADNIVLMPFDTQGTPEGAANAAQTALSRGAQLILGPLRSQSTQAAAPLAQGAGVPMISFSNDRRAAGPGVYVMGFVPGAEVDRAVSYTHRRGARSFALLAPDSVYGTVVGDALRDTAQALGAQVAAVHYYDPAAIDFAEPVQALSEMRTAGGGQFFDALMIAEGGQRLRAIAAYLSPNNLDAGSVRVLGTGLWEDAGLGREPSLVGAWYAVPPPSARNRFLANYQETYGAEPHRLASLAYDAAAMAAVLARSAGPAGFGPAVLEAPGGFLGADGLFRFGPNGIAERGLAVMEVRPGGAIVVDPGIRTFQPLPAGAAGT